MKMTKKINYIDLGLHRGDEIEMFTNAIKGDMRIFGFEADGVLAKECAERYKDDKRVTIINKAVCNKNGKVRLYHATENDGEGNSIFKTKKNVDKNNYTEVEGIKLSDWIKKNIPNFRNEKNIIRFNIEGAELYLMEDLVKSGLYKYVKVFLGSHRNDILKCSEIADRNKDYQIMLEDNGIKIYPYCKAIKNNLSDFELRSLVTFGFKITKRQVAIGAVALLAILFGVTNLLSNSSEKIDVPVEIAGTKIPVFDELKDKTPEEKIAIKSDKIKDKVSVGKKKRSKYDIEIVNIESIEGGVQVFARAWENGKQIGFGEDGSVDIERFVFYLDGYGKNSDLTGLVVPDPNGDIEVTYDVFEEGVKKGTRTEKYREDPEENLLIALEHVLDVKKQKFFDTDIVAGKIGNTTSTFNPEANVESTSVDGSASRVSVNETWATIRGSAGNNSNDSLDFLDEPGLRVSTTNANNWRNMIRAYTLFNTSALPDGNTISSATYSLYIRSKTDTITPSSGTMGFRVVTTSPASDTAVVNSDYGSEGTTALANDILIGSISTSAYNDWTMNATGISAINATGITKLGVRHTRDADNSEPTGSHSLGSKSAILPESADNADSNKHPKLVVEHSAGDVATPFYHIDALIIDD